MEVILLQNIKKLGSTGDIVNVAVGFARNYLLPNNLVLLATQKNKEIFEQKKKEIETANATKRKEASDIIKKIQNKSIIIVSSAAEDGRLYGAIKKKDIALALEPFSTDIAPNNIFIDDRIKQLGIYNVVVNLYDDVETTIQVAIARSESEGKQAFIDAAKPKKVTKDSVENITVKESIAATQEILNKPVNKEETKSVASEEAESTSPK
jgi:large subunit ribosomal protein L9